MRQSDQSSTVTGRAELNPEEESLDQTYLLKTLEVYLVFQLSIWWDVELLLSNIAKTIAAGVKKTYGSSWQPLT